MKFHNIDQNTEEWFGLRCGKITASQFKTVFSKPSTKGYWDLIYKKRAELKTGEIEDSYSNKYMERGIELEPIAKNEYENYTFETIDNGGFFEYNKYIGASPDGLLNNDGLIEIKCPIASTMERYIDKNTLPSEYYYQVHGQMFCSGRDYVMFVAFHPKYDLFIKKVDREDLLMVEFKEKLTQFTDIILNK